MNCSNSSQRHAAAFNRTVSVDCALPGRALKLVIPGDVDEVGPIERRLQSVNGRSAKIYQSSSVTDHGHRGRLRRVSLEALQAPSFKRERREQRLHVELMPLQEKQARVEHRIFQNKLGGAQEIQCMDIRDWHTCLHRVMSFNERSDNEPQS
jgi:hypothetical protein